MMISRMQTTLSCMYVTFQGLNIMTQRFQWCKLSQNDSHYSTDTEMKIIWSNEANYRLSSH